MWVGDRRFVLSFVRLLGKWVGLLEFFVVIPLLKNYFVTGSVGRSVGWFAG